MSEYPYDSRWLKLTERLQHLQPDDCVAKSGDKIIAVFSDSQLIAITGGSASSEPLPFGNGTYSIHERALAAGFIVRVYANTPTGRRIKVFRTDSTLAECIRHR